MTSLQSDNCLTRGSMMSLQCDVFVCVFVFLGTGVLMTSMQRTAVSHQRRQSSGTGHVYDAAVNALSSATSPCCDW